MVSHFDVFFRVIPCTTSVGHEDREENTGDGRTSEETTEGLEAVKTNKNGDRDSERAGEDHLAKCSVCGDLNTTCVVSFDTFFTVTKTFDFTELATNFFDHLLRSATNSFHRERGEPEGKHTTDQETCHDFGVDDVECEVGVRREDFTLECREESESCQCSRTDRETFTDRCGGVTNSVEVVCACANFFTELSHLSDTTSVVSDGTVSINSELDTCGCEHTEGCDRDTVESCEFVSDQDRDNEDEDGTNCGVHTNSETGDDGGRRTCFTLFCDLFDGSVFIGSVDFAEFTDERTSEESEDHCDDDAVCCDCQSTKEDLGWEEPSCDEERCDCHKDNCDRGSSIECFLWVSAFFCFDEVGTSDGDDDTNACEEEGEEDGWECHFAGVSGDRHGCTEDHRTDDGADIGFEEVRTHTSNVTNVVTNVISDCCGVTWVIFGDTCFDFTDEVSTDVSSFGVDTTTNASEEGDT